MCNMCTRDVTVESVALPPPPKKSTLERMKKKHGLVTDPEAEDKQKEVAYQPDLLAVSTQYSKLAYDMVKAAMVQLQETKAYVVLTRTSQPYQVALAVLVALVWLIPSTGYASLRGWRALYVGALATHFGAQIWMTLVSGIVLYFSLPRHEFGRVQTVLFPVYYAFSAMFSLVAFFAYFRTQTLTRFEHTSWIQFALLLVVFAIEAYVSLRMIKPMLRAKHTKTQMEEAAGGGQEVGRLILGELAHCPRYMRVLKTFRAYHSTIAMGNLITLGCSLYSVMGVVDTMCR